MAATKRKPLVLSDAGIVTELPSGDFLGGLRLASGTVFAAISIAVGGSTDLTIPFNDPMPDTNYEATCSFLTSVSISSMTIVTPAKAKTASGVTFTIKNTGVLALNLTVGLLAVAGRIGT